MRSFVLSLGLLGSLAYAGDNDWLSPEYKNFYEYPLPIPPIKEVTKSSDNVNYYEIDIKPVDLQIYPNLAKTRHVGYDGMVPGPTIMVKRGKEAVVRFVNHADRANSVHLHGSYSRAPFDGWAEDTTEPGQYKDYYYPNAQNARTLWYHDHAIDHTAENAYFGQAGFYIMHDDEELGLGLPQGIKYDIPLALSSKRYNADGSLWDPEANGETVSVFGDVIQVNGQPWPFHKVEPRKYRFRFLDTSISRSFQLYFESDKTPGTRLNFNVIGSDTGLLTKPVPASQLDISMAERWEVVFDFAGLEGQNVTLRNMRKVGADDDFAGTDKVMRFVVGSEAPTDTSGNGPLPGALRTVDYPPSKSTPDRHFKFERSNGHWMVNGVDWSSGPEARVIAKPERGAVEVWDLENSAGGWTHPIHVHLVDFQVVSRTGGDRSVLPYEAAGLKDVVWLNKGETVRVIARYAPWDGLYMFHCHNLIHEDHEMMAAMNITAIADLGYPETTRFLDPMESTYRSKSFNQADWTGRTGEFSSSEIEKKCNYFLGLNAYKDASGVEKALEAYWKTHTPTTLVTQASASASGSGSGSGSGSASGSPASTTTTPAVSGSAGTPASSTSTSGVTSAAETKTSKTSTTKTSTTKATTTSKK